MPLPPDLTRAPSSAEVDSMACVLEGQHGFFAAGIAEFFSSYHEIAGDDERALMWTRVVHAIHDRECARVGRR